MDLRVNWGWNGLQKNWNGFLWIRIDWSGSQGQLGIEWIGKRIGMDFCGLEWIGVDLSVNWGWNGVQKD